MQDAPEQAQAAEAPETVAEESAALETSAPESPATEQTNEPKTIAELDALANEILADDSEPKKAEPKAEEKKPEEPKAEPEATEPKASPNRVRLSDLKDTDKALVNTAVQMVRDGLASDIPDAIGRLTGIRQTPEAQAAPAEKAPEAPTVDPYAEKVESQKAEIAEILKQLTAAKNDFNNELETELTDKLLDLKSDMKLLQYQREQDAKAQQRQEADQAQTAYETHYDSYRDQAVSVYPDAAVEGSQLFEQIAQDIAWFEQNNPAIFNTPNYPLLIAGGAAAKIGVSPTFSKTAAAAQAAPVVSASPVAKVAARPANPLVGGSATTVSSDTKSAIRQVEAMRSVHDLDALAEAMFGR